MGARKYDFILYNVLSLQHWRITNERLHNKTNCDISRCKFHLNAQAKKFNTPEWNSERRFCKQLCQHNVNFSTYMTTLLMEEVHWGTATAFQHSACFSVKELKELKALRWRSHNARKINYRDNPLTKRLLNACLVFHCRSCSEWKELLSPARASGHAALAGPITLERVWIRVPVFVSVWLWCLTKSPTCVTSGDAFHLYLEHTWSET